MGAVIFDRVYASSDIYDWYKTVRGKGMNNYGRVLRSATLWIIFHKIPTLKMKKQTLKLKFPRLKLKKSDFKVWILKKIPTAWQQ